MPHALWMLRWMAVLSMVLVCGVVILGGSLVLTVSVLSLFHGSWFIGLGLLVAFFWFLQRRSRKALRHW